MSAKTAVSRRCIVIHGVPGDISQTSLRQEIKRQHDVNVVRIEEIQGAEANRKLKRWILELEGEQYAKRINNKSLDLEYDEQYETVNIMDPTECELPLSWISPQMRSVGQSHNQTTAYSSESILVEDIPSGVDEEILEMCFTSKQLSSCKVKYIDFNEVELNAVIEFESPEDVTTVLDNLPIFVKKTELSVKKYIPNKLCTVIVKGPTEIMNLDNEDTFEMYFENEDKSGGGDIANIEFRPNENAYYVTFEEEDVAKRVACRGGHRLKRKDIDVELYMPNRSTKQATAVNKNDDNNSEVMTYDTDNQPVNKENSASNPIENMFDGTQKQILVEDIPTGVDDDMIDMCFSSKKLKLCTIDSIDFDEKEMNAVITFKSAEDVKTVLDNCPIQIKKKDVTVQIYVPKKLCTIIVRGPAEIMKEENDETFEMYFGNEKKSGGGDIEELAFIAKDNAFYITFEKDVVAKRVVDRGSHRLMRKDISVELLRPSRSTKKQLSATDTMNKGYAEEGIFEDFPSPVTSDNSAPVFDGTQTEILVEDIPDGVDEEMLEMSFSSRKLKSCTVTYIDLDETEMNAVIRFDRPSDVKTVLDNRPIQIKKKEVTVQIYVPKKLCTIIVRGPAEIMKEENDETFEMYFGNEKKSGGGEIDTIDFQAKENAFYITFTDEHDAKRAVRRGGHRIMRKELSVELLKPSRSTKTLAHRSSISTVETIYTHGYTRGDIESFDKNFPSPMAYTDLEPRFDGTQKDILVEDIPDGVDEETLEMSFSSRKLRSCIVTDIDFDETEMNAVIGFERPSDVKTILDNRPIKIKKTEVSVQIYVPKKLCTVIVRGPKEIMKDENEETFEMYFDRENKSGGGKIAEIKFTPNDNACFITFEGEDVAKRVVNRGNHRIMRKDLQVELLIPSRSTKASKVTTNKYSKNDKNDKNKSQNANFNEDVESKPLKTVKVRGVKMVSSRDSVHLYFENKNKAGGGEIEKFFTDDNDDDVIYIEYKDESVAKSVVGRKHTIDGHVLEVILHTPSVPLPSYSDRLLIKGLNSQITFNVLDLYMEARMGLTLVEGTMIYHVDQEDTALVTIHGAIDMAQVEEACKSKPLEGSYLKISKVPISNCVLVSNISDTVTADTVTLYFENTTRSNGGPVENVDLFINQSYCLVYFEDYRVVDNVLSKEQTLDGRKLDVKRYFQCIGRAEGDTVERIFKRPNSVTIKTHSQKIHFIHHSVAKRDALEKELAMCHATVNWPSSDNVGDVELCCSLSEDVKDCVNLAKTWAATVTERFEQAINTVDVARIFVVQDILGKVNEKLVLLKTNAEVNIQIHDNNICIAGAKDVLPNIKKDVERLVQEIQEASEKEKTWLKIQISSLKPIETQMLLADEFTSRMAHKYTECSVNIDQHTNNIEIEGVNVLVNKIQIEMYQTKDTFQKTDINIPREAVDFYMSSMVKDFIDNKCKRMTVVAVWEVMNETLLVISRNEEMLREAVDIVRNSVKIGKVNLEPESRSLLQLQPWENIATTLNKEHNGKLSIKVNGDAITIICTDDIYNSVFETINAFLDKNTKYTDKLSFATDIQVLLLRHHLQDMQRIAKGKHVELREQSNEFQLIGTKTDIQSTRKELESFTKKVKRKKHLVSKPGISEFMNSEKGRFILKSVGSTHPVVVRTTDDDTEDDNGIYGTGLFGQINPSAESVLASCTASGDRKIHVFSGDMTDLNVDVFVNTANEKLSLLSGLGKVFVQKGGDAIARECNQYIEANKRLGESALFASTAGNLKAKRIFHISGPRWKDGHQGEDDKLTEVVFKALHQASGMGYKSLAMPAISCGGYGYPIKRATSVIITSVKNFFREVQDSELREIYLCDMKEETVNGFVEGLEREWGASNVQRFEKKKSTSVITLPRTTIGRNATGKDNQDAMLSPRSMRSAGPPPPKRNPGIGTPFIPIKLGNISVTVHKAEIAMHDIPVIVNTTSRNLDLNSGIVSKTILRQAGPEIQDDLKHMFPTGVGKGQVAVTKGYKLKCSNVIHGAVSSWEGQKTIDELKAFLNICMEETQKLNHSGIAFPAIGTGNLAYPKDVVAAELFSAVSEFAAKYPQSSIRNVDFILYPKDDETIQAFERELTNWSKDSRKGQGRARGYDHIENLTMVASEEHIYDELPSFTSDDTNGIVIGNVTISVTQGDIAQENADCIVNSSNEELDLEKGNVSKALVKLCGNELLKQANSMRGEMKREGLAITKAPGLQCRNIMHVVAKDSAPGWKQVIGKCLKKAKSESYRSIAFPALGTGMNVNAAEVAHVMFQAVTEFVNGGCGSLTDVRFVIFQSEMVETFKVAARHAQGIGSGAVGVSPVQQLSDKANYVNLILYALEDSSIRNAIEQLESLIDGEVHTESFVNPIIKRLDDRQNQAIKRAAEKYNVDLKVTDKGLEIVGIMTNVHTASTFINRILNDALQIESDKQSALLLQDVVQWNYIEVTEEGDVLQKYDINLNFYIEKAYRNQEDTYQYREDSSEIVVDFKTLQEYYKGETDDNKKTKIIRTDVYKDKLNEIPTEIPKEWKEMKGNLLVHALLNADPKYAEIEKAFMASSGSGFTVQKIEMVQNKALWQQYAAKKKQLEGQNPPGTVNERFLWHGTSEDTVDSVNAHGFNRSYCGKNAKTDLGAGVYFTLNASDSCVEAYTTPENGIKKVHYCAVLTGEFTNATSGQRVQSPKPTGGKNALYDSVTDDPANPTKFVIFSDTQAYPLFIVNFK